MANEKKGEGRKKGTCYYPTCATSRASAKKTVRDERKWESEIGFDGDGHETDDYLRSEHGNTNETNDKREKRVRDRSSLAVGILDCSGGKSRTNRD
jgi:hypothetical protein